MTTVRLPSRNKYHAKRTQGRDGKQYDSGKECNRLAELRLLEAAGKISGLQIQPRFTLLPPCEEYKRPLEYVADASYFESSQSCGRFVVEDVKPMKRDRRGKLMRTKEFLIKKRLMWQLLNIKVTEV